MKEMAYVGEIDMRTSGDCTRLATPKIPMRMNHTSMTGPKSAPTRPVP